MEFGRFGFACSRSLVAFAVLLLSGAEFKAAGQQAPPSSSVATPELPAAEPISQAAVGSATAAIAPANESSSQLRLGPGDLLELSIYNVPELATKARVGNCLLYTSRCV